MHLSASARLFCFSFIFLSVISDTVSAETVESSLGDWGTITHPAGMEIGQVVEVSVTLSADQPGQKLSVPLNWKTRAGQYGGFNTIARPNAVDATAGAHTFRLKPKEKTDLGSFVLSPYLSPSGRWKDKTESATVEVALGEKGADDVEEPAASGSDSASETSESPLGDWAMLKYPTELAIDQSVELVVTLPEGAAGQKLTVTLNWVKANGKFGGFNTVGQPNATEATIGEHTFKIKPRAKDGLAWFVITAYLSPTGKWPDMTAAANVPVAMAGGKPPTSKPDSTTAEDSTPPTSLPVRVTEPAAATWQPVPIRSGPEAAAGHVGGEGHQHIRGLARSPSDPDRVYLAIDTAGTWRSEDGGRSWLKNRDQGLHSSQLQAIGIDPENSDRFIVLAGESGGWSAYTGHASGLYLTEDAGHTWRRVLEVAFPYMHQPFQRIVRQIIVADDSTPAERRHWYAAIDGGGIYRSTDNAESWSLWASPLNDDPHITYYQMILLPSDDGSTRVIMGSSAGLHELADRNGDGQIAHGDAIELPVPDPYPSFTDARGRNMGSGVSGVLVHPDRPDDIVAVRRNGLTYRTTTGGRSADQWSEIPVVGPGGTAKDFTTTVAGKPAGKALLGYQDPFRPEHRWLIAADATYRFENRGELGQWRELPRSAFATEDSLLQTITNSLNNPHVGMGFSPKTADDIVSFKFLPWRWDGDKWSYANDGFVGFAWTLSPLGVRWVEADTYRQWGGQAGAVIFNNDIGPVVSRNNLNSFTGVGGDTWDSSGKSRPESKWGTSTTGDIHPTNPNYLIAFFGYFGKNGFNLAASRDGGKSWKLEPKIDQATNFNRIGFQRAMFARFLGDHPATGKLVAAAANLITLDADASAPDWQAIRFEQSPPGSTAAPRLINDKPDAVSDRGYALQAGHRTDDGTLPVLYAVNEGPMQSLLCGEPWLDAPADEQPYRWAAIYDDPHYPLRGIADRMAVIAADPHDARAVYFGIFRDPDKDDSSDQSAADRFADNETWIARLRVPAEGLSRPADFRSPSVQRIKLIGPGTQAKIPLVNGFNAVRSLSADPTQPNVVYLGLVADGEPTVWRLRFPDTGDRGSEPAVLTDVSGNLGREAIRGVSVRPHDGDVFVGTHFGTWHLPGAAEAGQSSPTPPEPE